MKMKNTERRNSMIKVNTSKVVRVCENFWNHIHFHPTDAIEDEWGQRILNEVAKDGVAETVRMYNMLEDIVKQDENGNVYYDFTENDVRMDYIVKKGFNILLINGYTLRRGRSDYAAAYRRRKVYE